MSDIALSVQSVLDLFSRELADVRFGDIDGAALSKASAAVQAAAAEMAAAEAAFAEAKSRFQERQEALLVQAHRALAYARVYADADSALCARIDAISLPRARRARVEGEEAHESPAERAPRGRPRKAARALVEPAIEAASASAE
jgi:hypothetical protein